MNYIFDEVNLNNNQIVKQKPNPINPSQNSVAIIAHIFYIDLWQEIKSYLENLEINFDLYISVPNNINKDDLKELFIDNIPKTVYMCENRGRDVLPFLLVMNHIGVNSYNYFCKLHTKKTGGSRLGEVWRKLLYFDLLERESVNKTLELFKNDENIGEITSRNTILDSKRYAYRNNSKIKYLCNELGIEFKDNYYFSGGTMFWSRTELVEPLIKLLNMGKLEFEEERGQKDHTLAHAIERFFGILVQQSGKKIVPSPSDYSKLPKELTEDISALILSQQYAGQDVYEYINELNEYINELEALAESMRIKNRIKRLPSTIGNLFKKKLILINILDFDLKTISKKLKKINPATLKKVFYYLKKGEFKYLILKVKEKLQNNINLPKDMVFIDLDDYFISSKKRDFYLGKEPIDIIIPVYNGYEYLEPLLNSIKNNTTHPYRLIVINDASPDKRVKELLKAMLVEHESVLFLENKENLGFVKSVNKAVKEARGDFVILNTDTEVPPFWLERLMYPIKHLPKVATTTPFTNSGTIASFPKFLEDNEIFEGLDVATLDKHFFEVKAINHYAKAPTGVGFCMGVNYNLVKEIGFFDEESFSKGYGEENDWCQRAIQKGYSNLIVPNLFVYHKHGGSFSSELKQKLLQKNQLKLLEKHPTYNKQVQEYIAKDPHKILRKLLVITASTSKEPLWVMFDHALGGGANHYAKEVLDKKLNENANTLVINYDYYTDDYKCYYKYKEYEFNFAIESIENLDILLSRAKIKELFLNSLVSYPNQKELLEYIAKLAKNCEVTIPIHDYFALCPNYTLLNQDGKYCGVPDTKSCQECLASNNLEWKHFFSDDIDIITWRELWFDILEKAEILVFSNSSKEILKRAYPNLKDENIKVTPHKVEGIEPIKLPKKESKKITIGILGAINYAKGASIVKELVERIDKENLDIDVVVIGIITEQIDSKHFKVTGRYKKDELKSLVVSNKIDIFLIPSICPETFSYTTQEIINMQLPVMVFNLGAPAERVKEYKKGYVLDEVSADAVLEVIKKRDII